MNKNLWIIIALMSLSTIASGEIIFSQDFSGGGTVSDYVNPNNPNSGQWNDISWATVNSAGLSFGAGGSFTRSTDFSPTPQALIYKFDVSVKDNSFGTRSAAVFQIGSGFSKDVHTPEKDYNAYAQFGLNFANYGGGFSFRNIVDNKDYTGTSFSGKYTVTWVINNSGTPVQYQAPDQSFYTLGNDRWDLWCGSFQIFKDVSVPYVNIPLTDLKFSFNQGSGTITLDNFSIDTIQAVPEPASAGLLGVLFICLIICAQLLTESRKRWRAHRVAFVRTWARYS
jgi:hypothetical protein